MCVKTMSVAARQTRSRLVFEVSVFDLVNSTKLGLPVPYDGQSIPEELIILLQG